ncbi:MAG: vWA domain-containing protein [Myxococcota bacterium]|nr:vWA domain-containing protein [Myxococcota bacterium]
MKRVCSIALLATLGGCDLKVPLGAGSEGMCLDDFLAMVATDRSTLEETAAARGIATGELLDELIDGTLGIADVLFDCSASDALDALSEGTGGRFVQVDSVDDLVSTLMNVTEEQQSLTQDIAFLVDATGSMSNDIDGVRVRLDEVLGALEPDEDRVTIAWYRDRHVDSPWYRRNNRGLIAPNAKQLESFLANIDPKGGGDLPESLYDGAMKVLAEVDWDSERRVLVIMTDAGPTDRDTHSLDDVVRLAGDHGVSIVAIMVGL